MVPERIHQGTPVFVWLRSITKAATMLCQGFARQAKLRPAGAIFLKRDNMLFFSDPNVLHEKQLYYAGEDRFFVKEESVFFKFDVLNGKINGIFILRDDGEKISDLFSTEKYRFC